MAGTRAFVLSRFPCFPCSENQLSKYLQNNNASPLKETEVIELAGEVGCRAGRQAMLACVDNRVPLLGTQRVETEESIVVTIISRRMPLVSFKEVNRYKQYTK